MISYTKARISDVIDASENASEFFAGDDTYEDFFDVYEKSDIGYAMWVDGKLLGVFAISKPIDGSSGITAIMTDVIKKKPKESIKALRHLCDIAFAFYGVEHLNFIIRDTIPRAEKYAHTLGFTRRGKDVMHGENMYRCYWRVACPYP